jgi:hypothetical protein
MPSKKLLNLIGLLFLMVSSTLAQSAAEGYDVQDSSVVPAKSLPQHTEFMAHNYAFPALPKNQWEIGANIGLLSIAGDVKSGAPGFGAGLHVRKALGYVFSIRGNLGFGTDKGLNYDPSQGYRNNKPWSDLYFNAGNKAVYYNYKSNFITTSLEGVVSLNNIRFHKGSSKVNPYIFAGIGGVMYDTKINMLNGSSVYDFSSIPTGGYDNRKNILSALKTKLDDSYETSAVTDPNPTKVFGKTFVRAYTFGGGLQFKLSNKLSLSFEDKVTMVGTDLLDGHQWEESWPASPQRNRFNDALNYFSAGINIAVGKKAVEPLWWINPLNYAYNEINKPRHMQLPKPVLDDKDGDGVTDQFDTEPNTPAGAPVDSHGVSRDTDGDGVPDYKDKELITPSQCQPVDADGVGKCPEPRCCSDLQNVINEMGKKCKIGSLPSVTFKAKTVILSTDAQALLATVATKMRDNSECKVAVIGYCATNKSDQQLSWDRVNAIINYLVDKEGISADRFVFKYGQEGGDCNTVDLQDGTSDEGPTTVPAPHPNLRRKG